MPDTLLAALETPGLWWLATAAFVAAVVRGFSGFGTALVFLPAAAQVLPPVWAVIVLTVMDAFGPLPILPRAWRECHRNDLRRLLIGTVITVPIGVLILRNTDPEIYRYGISGLALIMLVILLSGFRYSGEVSRPMVYGIGGGAGFVGGVAGLPGPVVILFYMASRHGPAVIRANTHLYLWAFDILFFTALILQGGFVGTAAWIGLFMVVPTFIGNLVGTAIFNPDRERLYRTAAYIIIAASAISALPFWNTGAH